MSEKKTDNQILKAVFNDLDEQQQERFFEIKRNEIKEKYKSILPKNIKTHIVVLENGFGCILRHPKPQILSKALGAMSGISGEPDMFKAGKYIIDNCWVVGDKEIQDNDDFLFAACIQALGLVEILQGSIKKN